jgi:hypothetical protein
VDAHDASPSAAGATTNHRRNISIRSLLFSCRNILTRDSLKILAAYTLCKIPKQYSNTLNRAPVDVQQRLRGQCIEKQQDCLLDFGPMAIPGTVYNVASFYSTKFPA